MTLDPDDFHFFQDVVKRVAGIHIADTKKELVQSRLRAHVQRLGFDGFSEYRQYIETLNAKDPEWQTFINMMTTNKTDWFREPAHFDFLIDSFLPDWRKQHRGRLNVWSAACSTGEEPYTLAAVLERHLEGRYAIQASDIDTNVLSQAKNGVYPKDRLYQIPELYHRSTFAFGTKEISEWFKVKKSVKANVKFQRCNLMESPYPWTHPFDLIFCRNVLIYFQKDAIKKIVDGLYAAASPGAVLIIGHSESLQNIQTKWRQEKPSIFRKPGA